MNNKDKFLNEVKSYFTEKEFREIKKAIKKILRL
jgi:hypothetical protein